MVLPVPKLSLVSEAVSVSAIPVFRSSETDISSVLALLSGLEILESSFEVMVSEASVLDSFSAPTTVFSIGVFSVLPPLKTVLATVNIKTKAAATPANFHHNGTTRRLRLSL